MAEPTLQEKVDKLQQPTTALGAQLVGGTPKQQDMAGTKAAKTRVKKEATLAGTERLESQGVAAGVAPTVKRAEELAKIGGAAAGRVAKLVTQAVNTPQLTQTTPQVNATALGTALNLDPAQIAKQKADPKSVYNQAVGLLNAFVANPKDEKARAAALQGLSALGIPAQSAADLIDTSAQAVGAQISRSPLTVAQMFSKDFKELVPGISNINQLAAVLKMTPAELGKLSISDLPTAIEKVRQAEVAQVDSIRAQLAALPPDSAQAQLLQQQLQSLVMGGAEAAQQQVDQTVKKIDLADEIQIGEEKFNAEQLLGDGELSDLVVRWLTATDPKERERLVPAAQFAGLHKWLTTHEQELGALAGQLQSGATTFDQATQGMANLGGGALSPQMLEALGIDTTPEGGATTAGVAAAQAALDKTGIGQLLKSGDTALVEIIKGLPADTLKMIAPLPADQIKAAYDSAQALQADPDLAKLSGVSAANGFVLDPKAQAKIATYKPIVDQIKKDGRSTWLEQPWFTSLPPADMATLVKNPKRYETLASYHALKAVVDKVAAYKADSPKSWEPMLADIFGPGVSIAVLDKNYADATRLAGLGDEDAKNTKRLLEMLGYSDVNRKFSAVNANKLKAVMANRIGARRPETIISGLVGSVPGVNPAEGNAPLLAAMTVPVTARAKSTVSEYSQYFGDGKLDPAEVTEAVRLGLGEDKKILNFIKGQPKNAALLKAYNDAVNSYATTAISQEMATVNLPGQPTSLDDLRTKLNQVEDTPEGWKSAVTNIDAAIVFLQKQAEYPARRSLIEKSGIMDYLNSLKSHYTERLTTGSKVAHEDAQLRRKFEDEMKRGKYRGSDVYQYSWDNLSPEGRAEWLAGKPIDWERELNTPLPGSQEQDVTVSGDYGANQANYFGWSFGP